MAKSPSTAGAITYAAFGPGLRVMAWPTPGRVFLYVEASGGRLRKVAEDVWRVVGGGGKTPRPKLESLVLLDEDANDEIAEATVGIRENAKRTEIVTPIIVGTLSVVVLLVAVFASKVSWELVAGAAPAFLAAILALVWLAIDTKRRKLIWS